MTLNDNPEKLKEEEQRVLDNLIKRIDRVIDRQDERIRQFVYEAKQANVVENPDLYLDHLLAEEGIKSKKEKKQDFLQARDELYDTRLLIRFEADDGDVDIEELKVGLHSCQDGSDQFVISWKFPVCRHYLLDNSSVHFEGVVDGRFGKKHHTNFTLLVKNKVKLRFTRVAEAMNLYPGTLNNDTLCAMKETGFFSEDYLDYLISKFDPNEVGSNAAVEIISDEFLQELLQRRSSAEFKNIVFSIQKKQGEIIQAPYSQNMIVQGCAGSGKSMIMLHRLPIILYDNPNSLTRSNLYVITPSQMYIQMAESMRKQLEISDINMGTIEQYYDYCIEKYAGHTAGEYKKQKGSVSLSTEQEKYVYSTACIEDVRRYFEILCTDEEVSLEKAFLELGIAPTNAAPDATYARRMKRKMAVFQEVLSANEDVIYHYSNEIQDVLSSLSSLSSRLRTRQSDLERELSKRISREEKELNNAKKELEKLDPEVNAKAIQNRNNAIKNTEKYVLQLRKKSNEIRLDTGYFSALYEIGSKIRDVIEPFSSFEKESKERKINKIIYAAIQNIEKLIGAYDMLLREFLKIEEKYKEYLPPLETLFNAVGEEIKSLQKIEAKYLNLEYYNQIKKGQNTLADEDAKAVTNAYAMIMGKMGNNPNESGAIKAMKCSPYLYLQILYQYFGAPNKSRESLLSIDEAQGISPEEIRLLKNINGESVIFNLFGDERQHIEGSKGINSWSELADIFPYQQYDMQENYRNASQITEYCNKVFDMDMVAINTSGKGVHELQSEEEFRSAVITQLLDMQRVGLAAIIVSNKAEAKYLVKTFAEYSSKINDVVNEEAGIHRTRWNIITIADAKGLEFSSVIAISGRMSKNERYIAYTRALDDLYVYQDLIDLSQIDINTSEESEPKRTSDKERVSNAVVKHSNRKQKTVFIAESEVNRFFEERGLDVIDMRAETGRLWVVGEKKAIQDHVNHAVAKFGISGKYLSSKEINNRYGWCTKTDK